MSVYEFSVSAFFLWRGSLCELTESSLESKLEVGAHVDLGLHRERDRDLLLRPSNVLGFGMIFTAGFGEFFDKGAIRGCLGGGSEPK